MEIDFKNFSDWLEKEKGFSKKGAHDVTSRLKRVRLLLNDDRIPEDAIEKLKNVEEFKALSVSVRSQLRRADRLYLEYSAK